MKKFKSLLLLVALTFSAAYAGTVKGTVTDAKTGEPLAGANVYVEGSLLGAATDMDGNYFFELEDGKHTIVCSYIGYKDEKIVVKVSGETKVDFPMSEFFFSQSLVVVADRARERETPVAYTNISKKEMEISLGSQDIPMVMKSTPSVYATMQGGGAGDARINVRGFDQKNVAIMINGVPVNDMENGWVYWSNWDGVGDATSDIQVQRGLSAVNIATPSIGGTMNIITDPSAQDAGFKLKREIGSGEFMKTSFFAHSGMTDYDMAFSAGVVRKEGIGVIDATWTDAWAYYLGASWHINDENTLELYALGAPQRHGQNLYRQNIASYDSTYAKSLDGYNDDAVRQFVESDAGRYYNETWNGVSPSYVGKQYWDGKTSSRFSPNFINERENYYHKPQVNLNWYSQLNDDMALYTILYYSGGQGGGSGTFGSIVWDYNSQPSRIADWDATIARNDTSSTGSLGILRNSVNNQYTFGGIARLQYRFSDDLNLAFGVDARMAEIEHYREVRDLLGGDYWDVASRGYGGSSLYYGSQTRIPLGGKIDYFFTNDVRWLGGYAQGEYTMDDFTFYGTVGVSGVVYEHTNHFIPDPSNANADLNVESDLITAYQFKGGASYRVTDETMVYGNFGVVSKVPIFDQVIDDSDGTLNSDPLNETFYSGELGGEFRGFDNMFVVKGNAYYTMWLDRSYRRFIQTQGGDDEILSLSGVDQTHIGVELEAAVQPHKLVRFDLGASYGIWEHTDDAKGSYKDYSTGSLVTQEFTFAIKDLYTGDAPQTQLALGVSLFPIDGLTLNYLYRYYADYYSEWEPGDRSITPGVDPDRAQVWKAPDYSVSEFHANYVLPIDIGGARLSAFAHVFNLFDQVYVQDATDNSSFNAYTADGKNHKADDAEVYLGLPRTFNIGVQIEY